MEEMYSPVLSHAASNTMTNKSNKDKKIQALQEQVKQLKNKRKTPFGNAGAIAGKQIGSMFGFADMGKGVGRFLGSGIGSIFGSGDYTLNGTSPSYNVLANSAQIPKFDTKHSTNIVCHREYLGDIMGTTAFDNKTYPLNPGIATTFPWLSTVAQNYQEYRFHGLIFEFRSLVTDFVTSGAPGVVIMSTNYNAEVPAYSNKQQMENAEFAVSTKPTINLMHGIECDINQSVMNHRYVRTSEVDDGQDLRFYDHGNFQFATQSNPNQNLGELWVSYCVELLKPKLDPETAIVGDVNSYVRRASAPSPTDPFGAVLSSVYNNLDSAIIFPNTAFTFKAVPESVYEISYFKITGGVTGFTMNISNCTTIANYDSFGASITSVRRVIKVNSSTDRKVLVTVSIAATTLGASDVVFSVVELDPKFPG